MDAAPCGREARLVPRGMSGVRWLAVLGAMVIELCGGSIYITGLYTSDLKHRFFQGARSQQEIEQLVFACNLGNWLPAAGFFSDSRIGGARNTAWVGAVLTILGYLGVWAWSSGAMSMAYWQVWIFWFLWGHGSGWFDNAAVSTTARNFPLQRGRAVALVKAFYGLSGSVLTEAYNLLFFDKTSPFLLFLGIFLSMVGVVSAPLLREVPRMLQGDRDEPIKRLNSGLGIVIWMGLVLAGGTVLRVVAGSTMVLDLVLSGILALCLLLLAVILVRGTEGRTDTSLLATGPQVTPASAAAAQADMQIGEALASLSFWVLFLVFFAGTGAGLVTLNHVAQMVSALGGQQSETSVLVSLLSVSNCFGRVTMGVVPDALNGRVGRAWFLVVNTLLMTCAQLLIAVGEVPLLFAGTILSAFAYGGYWTLNPTILMELCGLEAFASLYNFGSLAVSAGSLLFSTLLASKLYDKEAALHHSAKGSCEGRACYRTTCLILTGSLVVSLFASAWLACRLGTRRRAV